MESRIHNGNTADNDLSNIMDYEKYYKIDNDGHYNLHFLNKNRLTIDQIREIFSDFGYVKAVNVSGNEYGLRFIKFKTFDETIRCIKGLSNHDSIKLLLEKSKMNDSSNRFDKKNSNQRQAAKTENSFPKTFNTGKQFNLNSAQNGKFSENESLSHKVRTIEDGQFDNADNFSDTSFRNSKHIHKSNANAIKYNKFDSPSRQQDSIHNFSNKIDYEKYCKIAKDGTYILHFANKKEFSIEEIKKLFSPYGYILSVYANEDKVNGLVFVRYKTLQEAEACLEGFQNSDVISILPQKDKINGQNTIKKSQRSPNQSAEISDTFQGTCNTGKQLHSNYDNEFSKAEEKSINNTISNENNGFDNANNFVETSRTSSHSYKSVNATAYSDSLITNKQHLQSSSQQNINHEEFKIRDYNQGQQLKDKSYFSTKPDANTYVNTTIYNEIPALISDTEIKQKEFDSISDGSLQAGTKNASKVINIPMQEIIVANIHSNYDAPYILHLFKKYNPIAATLAERHEGINIRYCHIYFKTKQDAVAIEEEFDNFYLSGKNLIVLRTSRLKEEAICK